MRSTPSAGELGDGSLDLLPCGSLWDLRAIENPNAPLLSDGEQTEGLTSDRYLLGMSGLGIVPSQLFHKQPPKSEVAQKLRYPVPIDRHLPPLRAQAHGADDLRLAISFPVLLDNTEPAFITKRDYQVG